MAPNAREHFRGGGADSLGTATGGAEVRARVREHLLALCPGSAEGSAMGSAEAEVDALLTPKLDDMEVCVRGVVVVVVVVVVGGGRVARLHTGATILLSLPYPTIPHPPKDLLLRLVRLHLGVRPLVVGAARVE